MIDKLVSIIIPTYNRSILLRETLNSVLNQTYQNFEILIIDDGSTDNTEEMIKSFHEKRIKYIFQAHTGLPASGRNVGLRHVKGEYIAFLDSDDLWLPRKLEIQIKFLNLMPEILIIASNGVFFPTKPFIKVIDIKKNTTISFKQLLENNIIINSSVLMRKDLISEIGLLDEDRNLKYGEDYEYWLRISQLKDSSILILKDVMVKYRDNGDISKNLYKNPQFYVKKHRILSYIYEKYNSHIDKNYIRDTLRELLYYYKISKERIEIIQRRKALYRILTSKFLTFDRKLLFFLEISIERLNLSNLIKKVKILEKVTKHIKIIVLKILKV